MQKDLRIKILKNIGTAFVKMGQFADAITSFEYIMAEKCDIQAALHLILCHYMLGDVDKMKRAFIKLLDVDNASLERKICLSYSFSRCLNGFREGLGVK